MYRLARAPVALASAAAALLGGQVSAQAPVPPATAQAEAQDQPTDEVIVRGRRMSDVQEELRLYVNKFVVEVAKTIERLQAKAASDERRLLLTDTKGIWPQKLDKWLRLNRPGGSR